MNFLISILSKIEYHLSQPRLRLFHSLYFNLRMLPFKDAIKLPILFYGPTNFVWLTGKVLIEGKVSRAMIKIGKNFDFFSGTQKPMLLIQGEIVFHGPCNIAHNYCIRISKDAKLEVQAYVFLGSSTRIVCIRDIKIGECTQFAFGCNIIDSNFHFLYDKRSMKVGNRDKKIVIGKNNWIGNSTSIVGGCCTGDYFTVASNSLVNKDFSKSLEQNVMLAGVPARIVKNDIQRIFSLDKESELYHYFKQQNYPDSVWLENYMDELDSFKQHYHNQ